MVYKGYQLVLGAGIGSVAGFSIRRPTPSRRSTLSRRGRPATRAAASQTTCGPCSDSSHAIVPHGSAVASDVVAAALLKVIV